MRSALFGAVLLVLLSSVPAWAEAPADNPIVTPVQAGGILDDIWNRREDALNQRNRPVMTSVEEGPALANDLAWMDGLVSYRAGLDGRRGLVGQVLLVPQLFTYPAYFFASTQVTNAPDPTGAYSYWTALVVVVRDDASSPWRIRLESWADGPAHADEVDRALATDQPERFAPPAGPLGISLDSVADRLTRVFSTHAAKPVDPRDMFTIGLRSGSQLVCFARSYVQSENRPWWNPAKAKAADYRGIPEGAYQTLASTYQKQQCAVVDRDTGGSPAIRLLTSESAFVSHHEVPQSPPPWLPVALMGLLLSTLLTAAVWQLRPALPGDPAVKTPDVVTLPYLERHTVLTAGLRVLLAALILIEVERWLLPRQPWLAALLAVSMLVEPVSLLLPARRALRFTGRILVRRPLAEVFDFIRDLRNEPKWQPLIVAVTPLPSTGSIPGRLFRSQQRLGSDLVVEYESRITEPAGQQVIASEVLGKWFPERAEWRLRAVPEGTVVTLARWFELGPLRAISHFGLERYRQGLRRLTLNDLDQLNRTMTETPSAQPTHPAAPAQSEVSDRQISAQYSWLRRLPIIGHSDIGISIASFIGCWVLYSRVLGDWFATGIMVMLLVHELGHYLEGRRVGLTARPPVFILGGAFVFFPGAKIDGLAHARLSLAGGLAGGLATAICLALYVLTGSPHLLPWVLAGAAANLFGSLLPFITLDVEAVLMAVGKWLPAVGAFAALAAGAAALALGVGDVVIPVIVFLAFVVLRLRYPGHRPPDLGGLTGRARLVIAGSWLALVAYLSVVFVLTAGWLT
jgi:hypothetical protein